MHRGIRHALGGGAAAHFAHSAREMETLGTECSFRERRADEAARSVVAWLKCEYMRPRVGEEFDAVVTGVTDFGLFVQLKSMQVDGLVHVTSLPADYFHFHERDRTLVGERTKQRFSIGDELRVRLVRVDSVERKIDFEHVAKTRRTPASAPARRQTAGPAQVSATQVFGLHAVRAVLARRPKDVLRLAIVAGARRRPRRGAARARGGAGIAPVASTRRNARPETGGAVHQGIVAEVRPSAALDENSCSTATGLAGPALVLVLDGVRSAQPRGLPAHRGRRGCDAVVVPRDRAAGLTPAVRKVAAGAAETVPFARSPNLARSLRDMKAAGMWIVGTAEDGDQDSYAADLTGPLALVMGSEGRGLRRLTRECCDFTLRLPMLGTVDSLNVSVATGIMLYEALRQRRAKLAESEPVR